MQYYILSWLAALVLCSVNCSQTTANTQDRIGGPCEGCEAIYESPESFDKLDSMAWLPDWELPGQKLAVNGTVYKADGKTPAEGVVIYIYHTDQSGVYPTNGDEKGWGKRHGYLRGWMKTGKDGFYKFFTQRPGSYPNSNNPAHIHITIKEPGKNEYYLDEYLFNDDPFLTEAERKKLENRGGSGILTMKPGGNTVKAQRDIYLGRNIPNYPK